MGLRWRPPVDFPCNDPLPPVLILVPLPHFHKTPRIPSIVIKPTDVKILQNYACKKNNNLAVTNQNRPQGRSLELRRGYQNIENIFIYKRQVTRHTERRSITLSGTPGARTKNMCKDVTAAGGDARCDRAPLRSHGWRHSATAARSVISRKSLVPRLDNTEEEEVTVYDPQYLPDVNRSPGRTPTSVRAEDRPRQEEAPVG